VRISAKSGAGLDALRAHLKHAVGYYAGNGGALSARRRHLDALSRARAHAEAARERLEARQSHELAAEELRLAHRALGEITGEATSDDLLGQIFSSFCIGK
jgi:tRNA modification GTPase